MVDKITLTIYCFGINRYEIAVVCGHESYMLQVLPRSKSQNRQPNGIERTMNRWMELKKCHHWQAIFAILQCVSVPYAGSTFRKLNMSKSGINIV